MGGSGLLAAIWRDKDSTNLFGFASLVAVMALGQLLAATWTGSLGLLSAAFHTTMDGVTLFISLLAMVLAKQSPTQKYSYGYDRFEVLSSFSNGVFLLFVCMFLVYESIERLLEPVEIRGYTFIGTHIDHSSGDTQMIIVISVMGMILNIIGVLFFHQYTKSRAGYLR